MKPNEQEISKIFWQTADNMFRQKQMTMKCPLCDRTHEIEERTRIATITIKCQTATYIERVYYCKNKDLEFMTGSMADENLNNARDALKAC